MSVDNLQALMPTGPAMPPTVIVDSPAGAQPSRVDDLWIHDANLKWHLTSPTIYMPLTGVRGTHFHPEGRVYDQTIATWNLNLEEARLVLDLNLDPADASNLAKATDLLIHYIRSDKIAEVVRRPFARLGGLALVDLLSSRNTEALLQVCQDMFRFEDANS